METGYYLQTNTFRVKAYLPFSMNMPITHINFALTRDSPFPTLMVRSRSSGHLNYDVDQRSRLSHLPVQTDRCVPRRHPPQVNDQVPDRAKAGTRRLLGGYTKVEEMSIQVVLIDEPLNTPTVRDVRVGI